MSSETKRYRYGNWHRSNNSPGPLPWQRIATPVCTHDTWPFPDVPVGPPELQYATDEEVARDRLRERFAPPALGALSLENGRWFTYTGHEWERLEHT